MNSDRHDSNIRTVIVLPYCCNGNYDSRRRGGQLGRGPKVAAARENSSRPAETFGERSAPQARVRFFGSRVSD